ncbi:hypothetical protein EZV62_003628 [Acer yangbiense]|uniref:FBD domain-containing protein n=1 Tax=Acer yangbiense TaxID=1000413 RepID=A0A5C7IHD6_9ROSI|nr:hypothetical protein EZV62_003628 [Acer yangbiense]
MVLCAKSLEVLKLGRCKVRLPIGSDVKLSYLRKLHLHEVDINNHAINNLFSGCPLIEEMIIGECHGFESMGLFGLSKINNITPFDINVTDCTNLKNIELVGASIKDESLYKLISELPFLESLCLGSCPKLKRVEISSPSLKTLKISKCYEVVELKIDSPNLSNFTFDGNMISLCSNALTLSDIDLCFNTQTQWYVKLVELLTQFYIFSETLKLQVFKNEEFNVPKELRQKLPSPLSSGKHFKLHINKISLPFSIAKVVDDLLSIAPHTKTVSIEYRYSDSSSKTSFEFSYKKPLVYEGEASSCFKSHPISCWQHCIKEVKLEIRNYDRIDIKGCSLKGVEFLEKIDGLCTLRSMMKCICYAIGNNVRKLKLGILSKRWLEREFELKSNKWYDLPPIVLCAKSIEVLKLRGCKLKLPRESNVKLPSLRRMHLLEVYSNSHVINSLLAGCPLIEEIVISNCIGIESLELFGLERLNDIMMANNKELKRVDMEIE